MIRAQDLDKARRLLYQRRWLLKARWDTVAHFDNWNYRNAHMFDKRLAQDVEAFRQRQIEEIDRQLREIGIEPPGEEE